MAVKIVTKKPAPKVKAKAAPKKSKLGNLRFDVPEVDQAAYINSELSKLKEQAKILSDQLSEIMEEDILPHTKGIAADQKIILEGDDYLLNLGEQSKTTSITLPSEKLHEMLGDVFYKLAKIGIGDLRKYLTPDELKKVIVEEKTGSRSRSFKKK